MTYFTTVKYLVKPSPMLPLDHLQKSNTIENLWIYILSLLREEEIHGWLFQLLVEKKFGFKPGKITSYRVLYRLEKDGFVKSRVKERRRTYQITKKGEEELIKAKGFYQKMLNVIK